MISRMFHAEADPKPPLSDYIQKLWYFSGILGTSPRERVLPDGSMNVVLDLRGSGSVASGAHSEYFVIDTALDMQVMGILFKPGGAFPFFKMPVSELRDTHADRGGHGKRHERRGRALSRGRHGRLSCQARQHGSAAHHPGTLDGNRRRRALSIGR